MNATIRRLAARMTGVYEVSSGGSRVRAMEGIRGVAVGLVFFVHFYQLYAQYLPPQFISSRIFHWAGTVGHTGVDLFFVLSGYLIYGVVRGGKKSVPEFLRRRLQRIYPTFLTVFAIYLVCMLVLPSRSKIPSGFGPGSLYLLENALLLPGLFSIPPMITVAWSLSYEIFYYVSLPLLFWFCGMRQWTARWRIAFFCGLAAAYCLVCAKWPDVTVPYLPLQPARHVRLILFAAGILVQEWTTLPGAHRMLNSTLERVTLIAVIGAYAGVPWLPGTPSGDVIAVIILLLVFTTAVGLTLTRPDGVLAGGLSWTPFRWLGNMSYSYYLCHAFLLNLCLTAARHLPGYRTVSMAWALLFGNLAFTWVGATLLFVWIEKPLSLRSRGGVRSDRIEAVAKNLEYKQ
jgi:exopolysaccharide production protein ExoZ